jgi:tRNA G26 N,N-dimethylase Trm1
LQSKPQETGTGLLSRFGGVATTPGCTRFNFTTIDSVVKCKVMDHHLEVLRAYRDRNRAKVTEFLLVHPCTDCGEKDVRVLEFDHRKNKIRGVGEMIIGHFSWKRIMAEIKKCDVRCANCHRRRTLGTPLWFTDLAQFKRNADRHERKAVLVHGTRNGYCYHKCRCQRCRAANARYFRNRTNFNKDQAP